MNELYAVQQFFTRKTLPTYPKILEIMPGEI